MTIRLLVSARIVLRIVQNTMAVSAYHSVRISADNLSLRYANRIFHRSACHRCRAKRGRCTGEKPVCAPCVKASAECSWPEGRRKKRTRREMEADERAARATADLGVQRTAPFPAATSRVQPYPAQAYTTHNASPHEHTVSPDLQSPVHWVWPIDMNVVKLLTILS